METPASASALYRGRVMHQRVRPARHRLAYRVYTLLVDLDELPALARRLRLFSLNRYNLFSLHERDYGGGDARGLRRHVERELERAGLPAGGAIRLLTMPRLLGYAFNPLNVYFCHAPDGALQAILYEVNNTFGERHSYLIEVDAGQARDGRIVQRCAKHFHVSPFLGCEMQYRFGIEPPAPGRDALSVGVAAYDAQGLVLNTRLDATRGLLSDGALLRAFCAYPLLTLKVVAGIHWEAARLLLKRLQVHRKPPPPTRSVTVIRNPRT
ncbi:MAG: DUF1365 family protein [Burkholderiales bacterium]|nr:DUF1365 family protein [Burkholderiales bacterium]